MFICNYNLSLQNLKIFHPKIECKAENVQKQSIIYVLGKYTRCKIQIAFPRASNTHELYSNFNNTVRLKQIKQSN